MDTGSPSIPMRHPSVAAWLETESPPVRRQSLQPGRPGSSWLVDADLRTVGLCAALWTAFSASHMTAWIYDVACLHGRVTRRVLAQTMRRFPS